MYSGILAGLALVAAAFAAPASLPRYEVVFSGEAPVAVTLNQLGEGRAASQVQVAGAPALTVQLLARGADSEYLAVQTATRTLTFQALESEAGNLSLPTVTTSTVDVKAKLAPTEKMTFPLAAAPAGAGLPLITITRLD